MHPHSTSATTMPKTCSRTSSLKMSPAISAYIAVLPASMNAAFVKRANRDKTAWT